MESRLLVRDQLLRGVVKRWFAFESALQSGTGEEAQREHALLVTALHEYEFALGRAAEVQQRAQQQLQVGEQNSEETRVKLERARQTSAKLRQTYKQAKLARSNHEEYEKLAELVGRYPSREETMATVTALKAEIEALEAEKKDTENKLALKNGQFQLLLHAIRGLQASKVEIEEGEL
jgi:seryl-tRNA synthetase